MIDRRCLGSLLLALAAVTGAPGASGAQAGPEPALSLEEAIALAKQNNPGYLASVNDADVAHWEVRSSYGRLLAPSLSVSSSLSWQGSGEQLFGSITDDQLGFGGQPSFYLSSYTLGLDYTLDGATLLAPGRSKANREATTA
nr:TolC family protein [Gemmatimonadota bacterium]NIR77100.1 TolC family protein [Gemmatimonadota bacterium]NIT85618.1 TolC family protein [Gemmatimonadota bacterium]NIU31581.1 TolC family protein [Gemmatimonadota bacterium]NIU34513.1 TolC family protein [Gemmatimonadota bacterium]